MSSPTWSPADDVALVHAAQAGDVAAFDVLYRRHARVVHAVLLGRTTRDEADDLVQQTFLTAWRRIASLREPAAFGKWVLTIARNARIDEARRRQVEATSDADVPTDAVAATDAGPDVAFEAERVLRVIATLPEAYREPLVLRLVEGMTGPEIAARIGLTPESVRVNLCRGMKRLREALG